jgi:putative DNA primase/helicase
MKTSNKRPTKSKGYGVLKFDIDDQNNIEPVSDASDKSKLTVISGADFKRLNGQVKEIFKIARNDAEKFFEPESIETLSLIKKSSTSKWRQIRARIKNMPSVSVTEIDKEMKAYAIENDGRQDQHAIALKVIEKIGPENIFHANQSTWLWGMRGVWEQADDKELKKIINGVIKLDFSNMSITSGQSSGVLETLKTQCYRKEHRFNRNDKIINCSSGELHHNGTNWVERNHERENYSNTQIPSFYVDGAKAPRCMKFLKSIFDGDDQANMKVRLVLELIGYSLTTNCMFEIFIMLIGEGANGKSVLLHVIESLVGENNVAAVQPCQFSDQFYREFLEGKVVNIVSELKQGATINEDRLKSITSGELVTVAKKGQDLYSYHPFSTCWFGSNHLPPTKDFSKGTRRRAMVIPFNRVFEEHEQDRLLKEKLVAELPGIFRLAVKYFGRVLKRGHFTKVREVENAVESWITALDPVAQFVKSKCVLGDEYSMPAIDCYRAYLNWTSQNGIDDVISQIALTMRLKPLGVTKFKRNTGQQLRGIKLR